MRKLTLGVALLAAAAGTLTSCGAPASNAATPLPEDRQVVGNHIKDLYMAASAAGPQSAEQKKLILRMADRASNGKELLLTMRAADGVFHGDPEIQTAVTAKMLRVATVDQLTDFAKQYTVAPDHARPYVERMMQLGEGQTDPRVWLRIRAAAARLKLPDLERQAQQKADRLSGR